MNPADLVSVLGADPYATNAAPPAPMPSYQPCEKCFQSVMERNAAFSRESKKLANGETISVSTKERAMRWQLRPIGGACPRCGNDKPQGTWPIKNERGSVTRVGEHGAQIQYLVTDHENHRSMCLSAEEYAALRRTPTARAAA